MAHPMEAEEKGEFDLELLLLSPFCWKATKTCKFFTDAYNFIKEKEDDDIVQFQYKMDLDALSPSCKLWYPEENWECVLGRRYFEIVTTKYTLDTRRNEIRKKSFPNINRTSVVHLLRVIRNKLNHNAVFMDADKKELNWFRKRDGKWEFDEQLFSAYWRERFSRLIPFLWLQFRRFTDTLQEFYPNAPPKFSEDAFSNLMNFPHQIFLALHEQLENGILQSRYHVGAEPQHVTLEFRSLPNQLLQKLLAGCCIVEIQVTPQHVITKWISKTTGYPEVIETKEHSVTGTSVSSTNFYGTMFIANKFFELIMYSKSAICAAPSEGGNRFIFYSNDDEHWLDSESRMRFLATIYSEASQREVSRVPVQWNELSESRRENLEDSALFFMQNKMINLRDILPECQADRDSLLSHLNGDLLNHLLFNCLGKVFEKQEISSTLHSYIERLISKRILVNEKIFSEHQGSEDKFVISNVVRVDLFRNKFLSSHDNVIEISYSGEIISIVQNNPTCKIFLLKNNIENCTKIISSLEEHICSGNVHFISYLYGNTFEWLSSIGSTHLLERNSSNFLTECHAHKETSMLDYLEIKEETEQIVFVSAKPGMGKSSVLKSITRQITGKYKDRIVLLTSFKRFLEELGKGRVTLESIFNTIIDLLCVEEFEKSLAEFWLKADEVVSRKLKFEIMLDGLDEVSTENLKRAWNTLTIIRDMLPSVRIWVTVRDHMLKDICFHFGLENCGYKLEPFPEQDQVDFLEKYWSSCWDVSDESENRPNSQELRTFAKQCINVTALREEVAIASIPLQCQFLAEIYEGQVLSGDLTFDDDTELSLLTLYGKMMERKFEVYFRKKKGIPKSVDMGDPVLTAYRDQMAFFVTHLSIRLIFGEAVADKFKSRLLISEANSSKLNETVLELGIIQNTSPLTFIHRTFAEFILAEFCCKVLFGEFLHIPEDDTDFLYFLLNEVLDVTFQHRNSLLECDFKQPTLCHFLNEMIIEKHPSWKPDIVGLSDRVVMSFLYRSSEISPMHDDDALFLSIMENGHRGITALLLSADQNILGLFVACISYQQFKYAQLLIENSVACKPENWNKLQDYDENGFGILHWAVQGLFRVHINVYPERINELTDFVEYVVEKDKSVLEARDAQGRTPLLLLLHGWTCARWFISLIEYLDMHVMIFANFGANLHAVDDDQNSVLHITHKPSEPQTELEKENLVDAYINMWNFFMEYGCSESTMNSVNCKGQSPLLSALEYFGEALEPALEIFQSYGADFNIKDISGKTALHISIEKRYSVRFIRMLIAFGADISVANGQGKNALQLAIENNNNELVDILRQL